MWADRKMRRLAMVGENMRTSELKLLTDAFRKHPFDPNIDIGKLRARLDRFAAHYAPPANLSIEQITIAGCAAERIVAGDGPHVLFLHGGGYVVGSAKSHRHMAAALAADIRGTVYVLEYRLAPEAPFPAAAQDCIAAYAELAHSHLAIVGDSAGGGLAFLTAIAARDRGLALPTSIVAISPWVNLGSEHECYDLLAEADPALSREAAEWYAAHYLGGNLASDPTASPLFAKLAGLPPTLIQISDCEVFFGDAARMHTALIGAGVNSELSVWKDMFHVWHLYWPDLSEGRDAILAAAAFIAEKSENAAEAKINGFAAR